MMKSISKRHRATPILHQTALGDTACSKAGSASCLGLSGRDAAISAAAIVADDARRSPSCTRRLIGEQEPGPACICPFGQHLPACQHQPRRNCPGRSGEIESNATRERLEAVESVVVIILL